MNTLDLDHCSSATQSTSNKGLYANAADYNERSLEVTRSLLRLNAEKLLLKLDVDEWISLIFLVLNKEMLPLEGFKLIEHIKMDEKKKVASAICKLLMASHGLSEAVFDPLIEVFYILGRYDILEDDLMLCLEHDLHQVCQRMQSDSFIHPERFALYQVFSDLPQESANELVLLRLKCWRSCVPGEPLEMTFVRNLDQRTVNYLDLITDIYQALLEENLHALAKLLQPFARVMPQPFSSVGNLEEENMKEENLYPLPQGEPHGLCVIINVMNFMPPRGENDEIPLHQRRGSDIDKDRLEGTFKLFGFTVIHLDNPDYEELATFFKKLRRDSRLYAVACLAVCVMTHGDENDNLYLADRSCIAITDLRKLCYAVALIDRPRLYIVQACRGDQNLRPMFLQQDATITSNSESDCIVCAATVRGYSAMRSQSSGSWFITDFCSSLQENGHCQPLKTILRQTRRKLQERVDKFGGSYVTQMSEDKDTLTKEVQLVRGSENTFLEGIVDLSVLEVLEEELDALLSQIVDDTLANEPHYFQKLASAFGVNVS